MIQAAGIAGAAAWTAPVIVDSLSSPAAAGSTVGPCQVFSFTVARSPGGCTVTASPCNPPGTTYSGAALCGSYLGPSSASVITTGNVCSTSGSASFQVTAGANCTFVGYATSGSACTNSVFTSIPNSPTVTVPIPNLNNNTTQRVYLAVNCS